MFNSNYTENKQRKQGAAHRLGAEIVTAFHHAGATVAIHYRSSKDATDYLLNDLNSKRADSAFAFQADLQNVDETTAMVKAVLAKFNGQLDVLVNNASTFYSTPFGTITTEQYDDLMGSNFRAPLFLTQACAPALKKSNGNIINMVDINSSTPLENFPVYCAAKAALTMLTKCSAIDLAPHVRCNSISPGIFRFDLICFCMFYFLFYFYHLIITIIGIILWPSGVEISPQAKLNLLDKVKRLLFLLFLKKDKSFLNTVRFCSVLWIERVKLLI